MKTLYDLLEEKKFEGMDVGDNTYDMVTWFEVPVPEENMDGYALCITQLAKAVNVVSEQGNNYAVVDFTKWADANYDVLEGIFDLSGDNKEDCMEEIVCTVIPGIVNGYTSDSVYNQLAKECKFEGVQLSNEEYKTLTEVGDNN